VRQACYNARLAMVSERTGERFDWHCKRHTLEHHEILLPPGCPLRLADSSVLWNAAEAAEKRKDAQVARGDFGIAGGPRHHAGAPPRNGARVC
jgi:MobA/MobL family